MSCCRSRFTRNRRQPTQPAMNAGQPPLDHLAPILEQMPPIGHLSRGRGTQGTATGNSVERSRAIMVTVSRSFSQSASVWAVRSGNRSTTRRASRSTRMVP